jgi:galactokinase
MTDEEFEHFKDQMDQSHEEMDAEYEIISKIIAQRLGYELDNESRD